VSSVNNIADLEALYWGGGQDAKYAALLAYAGSSVDAVDVLDRVQAIPPGGSQGQILTRGPGGDFDTSWLNLEPHAVPANSTGGTYFGVPFNSLQGHALVTLVGGRPNSHYSPFVVRSPIQITELAYQVASTPPTPLQLTVNLYEADSSWQPIVASKRVLSPAITHTAINTTTVTGLSETLGPGRYLTEVYQQSDQATLRAYGCALENLATMDFAVSPQNSGRIFRALSVGANEGSPWTASISLSVGGSAHMVLFKWSLL
jgi:hypothetical protein